MSVNILVTDEFEEWFQSNDSATRVRLSAVIDMLENFGVSLPFPYSSKILGARYNLRELRTEIAARDYRMFYVFDPKRNAVMLLGGDKTGVKNWYEKNVVRAESIYEKYLREA